MPQATEEATSVAALFPCSTLLVEEDATKAQLINLVADHDALHLASHATFSEENPAFSRIKMQGGWLTLDDIYNLDLDKEHVSDSERVRDRGKLSKRRR